MEAFNANLKNLSKNKFYLILIGLIAIIFATVLIYAYVEFSGTKISVIPNEEGKPYCGAIGSRSEGWYINSDPGSNRPKLIRWDNCDGCFAVCKAIGSRLEGWYSSCDNKLIKWDNCAEEGEQKCGIENCHGLDITCGPNIPDMCTEIYMIGDGCRKYAKCEIINGKCQLVQNKKFEDCKSCVEKCSEDFKNNPIKLSQCAYKCAEAEGEQTCDEKCKSLNYTSGICRTWPVVPDAERGCKENEKDVGQTSDCTLSSTSGQIVETVVGVGKTCCCQEKNSECAKEGEHFSSVYEEYPDHCCQGLTEWSSGMDTRISVGDKCYRTGLVAGSPVGTCIYCGNGKCEEIEDVCNCAQDCKAGQNSDYATVKEFCESAKYNLLCVSNFDNPLRPSSLCQLCEEPEVECTSEGEKRHSDDLGKTFSPCCEGLVSIPDATVGDEGICIFSQGSGDYCTKCGDGICKFPENKCNCSEDCKDKETLSADFNNDGRVGPADLGILLSCWGKNPSETISCKNTDINKDGIIGPADFGIMLSQWTTF